jgi:TorA maturation chaperone TorD
MKSRADTARLRQGLYRFFAGALLPPEGDRVETLVAAAAYLDGLGIEAFPFAGPWNTMLDAFEVRGAPPELSAEYIRLFASGLDGELCPPTESFYRANAEGGGLAAAVASVQRDYGEMGLNLISTSEPPDHVTSELEAMAGLCAREVAFWDSDLPQQASATLGIERSFLRRHLAAWFPAFRARVERSGRLPFYTATVDAAHAYLTHEVDFIGWTLRVVEHEQ